MFKEFFPRLKKLSLPYYGADFTWKMALFSVVLRGYLCIFFRLKTRSTIILKFCLLSSLAADVRFSIMIDQISILFLGVVLVISGRVGFYCFWYIDNEIFFRRFIILIFLFVLSIVLLILVPNLLFLMLGWDGLGLVSFLLVCYYQNSKSLRAAIVTALTNRVGDVLILSCIGIVRCWGEWSFFGRFDFLGFPLLGVLLVVRGSTKSAQVPFSSWLPAAIAAPTPVSSLVHSSTLVTAGVYLLIRSYNILEARSWALPILKFIGLLTIILAGFGAIAEVDFKKVIALSTLSQLGIIMFCIRINLPYVALFHLVTHATFKALLFVRAGAVIHRNLGTQDLRSLGRSWEDLPVRMSFLCVSSLSLMGVPFTSGFYSKDLILELALIDGERLSLYVLMLVSVSCTSWYRLRVVVSVVLGNNKPTLLINWKLEKLGLILPYFFLFFCAIFRGAIIKKYMSLVFFSTYLDRGMFTVVCLIPSIGVFSILMLLVDKANLWIPKSLKFLSSIWNLKTLSTQSLIMPEILTCYVFIRNLDQGWLEKVGPQGVHLELRKGRVLNQRIQIWYFLSLIGVLCLALIRGLGFVFSFSLLGN